MARSLPAAGLLVALIVFVVAACGAAPATPSATRSPAADPTPAVTAQPSIPALTPGPDESRAAATPDSQPTQTDTEWGRIWDALPSGFPLPPGAVETQADEPATAVFDLPIDVDAAATFMQGSLELASFSTLSKSGPFEDGSIVIESVGPTTTDCRVETTLAPAGGLTRMTVRYGAACPME